MQDHQTIKMKRHLLIISLLSVVMAGCYRDNEEQLYPATGNCDVTNVTYAGTVQPLLQSSGCLGCHSGAGPSGNISLEGYNNVRAVALTGKLFGAINHSPGFSPMPKGGNRMTACNISKIKAWIDAGSNNN
jgi:hypothetical protein